uniref:tRNA-splicing endonuclease subunit Sen54 N-terminal domain-containing protein n=1 Tax=Chenopodium quinoa TaxID=63459 RepID=A0A803MNH8_CHEQI
MDGRLEAEVLLTSLQGMSDSEFSSQDSADEELYSEAGSQTRLQFRSVVFKACWKDELGMAEIMKHKGNLLKSMGINRNGKIYLSIEETLFLVQIGALLLVDDKNTALSLREIYPKVAEDKSGCSWEGFKIYQHLKSLGYIVGRLGTPWSLKSIKNCTLVPDNTSENNNATQMIVAGTSIVQSLKNLQLEEASPISEDALPNYFEKRFLEESKFIAHLPVYEVYLPNSQFKKTCPGDPNFVVYPTSGHPPSLSDIKVLERQSNGLPIKVGHVDDGRKPWWNPQTNPSAIQWLVVGFGGAVLVVWFRRCSGGRGEKRKCRRGLVGMARWHGGLKAVVHVVLVVAGSCGQMHGMMVTRYQFTSP